MNIHCIRQVWPMQANTKVRGIVQSTDFWNYVSQKINSSYESSGFNKDEFKVIIATMITLKDNNKDTPNTLIEIIKNLQKFNQAL